MIVRVGISAPNEAAFQARIVQKIDDGDLPAKAVHDGPGGSVFRAQNWGRRTDDGTPPWVAYGEDFVFLDDQGDPITRYTLIMEADADMMDFTWDGEQWVNGGNIVPPSWEDPLLLDQLTL